MESCLTPKRRILLLVFILNTSSKLILLNVLQIIQKNKYQSKNLMYCQRVLTTGSLKNMLASAS